MKKKVLKYLTLKYAWDLTAWKNKPENSHLEIVSITTKSDDTFYIFYYEEEIVEEEK